MGSPNVFNNSKWRVVLSNIPTVTNYKNLQVYNDYVRSCTMPDYNCPEDTINYMHTTVRLPIPRKNEELAQLQIEFKASEDAENYTNLVEYMQELKYGQNVPTTYLKDNVVKNISIVILDNQRRDKKIIYFTDCFLASISSLGLIYGDDTEVSFVTTWSYSEMKIRDPQS